MLSKKAIFLIVIFLSCLLTFTEFTTLAQEDPTPTVWIKIYRIQKIDDIENILEGEADWRYEVKIWDGDQYKTIEHTPASNHDDIVVNKVHTFVDIMTVSPSVYVYLYEDDTFGYEVADISGAKGRSRFDLVYDLISNTLTGDEVIIEGDYYKTSGDYDDSVATDENDANLWFTIWDNYDLPTADAGSDQIAYPDEKVNFDGSGSTASSGSSIVKYEWDFENDGIVDVEGEKTSYTYLSKGEFTVRLRVTDNLGQSNDDFCTITVANPSPIANFTWSPSPATIQDSIDFVDTSQDDEAIISWFWDFGDGITSTEQSPSHQYTDKGDYDVELTVTDNDYATDSEIRTITIQNLHPTADFTYSPTSPKREQDVQFTDTSSDPEGKELTFLWDFGDGYTSTQRNPVHKYTEAKQYTINLAVTDDEGAIDSTTKTISISEIPIYEQQWFYLVVGIVIVAAVSISAVGVALRKRKKAKTK